MWLLQWLALGLLVVTLTPLPVLSQTGVVNVPQPYLGYKPPKHALRGSLKDLNPNARVYYPVTTGYDEVRKPWQTFYECNAYPTIVVQVGNSTDVEKALEYARSRNLHVTVRNGGHSYAGISRSYGLVLDVRLMNHTEVFSRNGEQLVMMEAGQLNIGAYFHLGQHNLTIPAGGCPSVGISGLTLGGGFGVLSRKFGLTCDQVTEIEAVIYSTAEGKYITVTITATNQYSDLFFAFRGGMGGNYGVVTKWTFNTSSVTKLHHVEYKLNLTEARAAEASNSPKTYDNVVDAIAAFMTWCDEASENVNCEMSIETQRIKNTQKEEDRATLQRIQKPETFNLEVYCICEDDDCSTCAKEDKRLYQKMTEIDLRNSGPLFHHSSDNYSWNEFVWKKIAGCEDSYDLFTSGNKQAIKECAEMTQTRVGRGKHNRKKSLFLDSHPAKDLMEDVILSFDEFADNIIVDTYTAANVEFYYWGGALAKPPQGTAPSAWDHREQKWLVHITGRFPDNASSLTIANVYYALDRLHKTLQAPYNTAPGRLQDYQNFADASLSYEAWSSFYFYKETFEKLEAINQKYNPQDIFRNQMSIPTCFNETKSQPAASQASATFAPTHLSLLLSFFSASLFFSFKSV